MTSPGYVSLVYHHIICQYPTVHSELSFSGIIFPLPLLVVHSSLKAFLNSSTTSTCIGFPHLFSTLSMYSTSGPSSKDIIACLAYPVRAIEPIPQCWSLRANRGSNWSMRLIFLRLSPWAETSAQKEREREVVCAKK